MSALVLKIIAVLSMLLDHLLQGLPCQKILISWGMSKGASYYLLTCIEPLGRLAFPIFAYLISEGCRRTKSEVGYISRLLLFGVISEVPFNLVFDQELKFGANNVFFTLALGAMACVICECLREWGKAGWEVYSLLFAVLIAAAAEALSTDYGGLGVLMIFVPYFIEKKSLQLAFLAALITVLYLVKASWVNGLGFAWLYPKVYSVPYMISHWIGGLAALIPIALYNGKRGKNIKWPFYIFYPAHLVCIYGVRILFKL